MSVGIYIPKNTEIIHETKVDFLRLVTPVIPVNLVQYDSGIQVIAVHLYLDGKPYVIPDNTHTINIIWGRKRNEPIIKSETLGSNIDRNIIYFKILPEMTKEYGLFKPVLEIVIFKFQLESGSKSTEFESPYKIIYAGSTEMIFNIDYNPVYEEYYLSGGDFINNTTNILLGGYYTEPGPINTISGGKF